MTRNTVSARGPEFPALRLRPHTAEFVMLRAARPRAGAPVTDLRLKYIVALADSTGAGRATSGRSRVLRVRVLRVRN